MNTSGVISVVLALAAACQNSKCPDPVEERQFTRVKEVENVEEHVKFASDGSLQARECEVLCGGSVSEYDCVVLSVSPINQGAGGGGGASSNETEVPMTGPAVVEVECETRLSQECE